MTNSSIVAETRDRVVTDICLYGITQPTSLSIHQEVYTNQLLPWQFDSVMQQVRQRVASIGWRISKARTKDGMWLCWNRQWEREQGFVIQS